MMNFLLCLSEVCATSGRRLDYQKEIAVGLLCLFVSVCLWPLYLVKIVDCDYGSSCQAYDCGVNLTVWNIAEPTSQ